MTAPIDLLDVHAVDRRHRSDRNVYKRKDRNSMILSARFRVLIARYAYRFSLDTRQRTLLQWSQKQLPRLFSSI